MSIKIGVVSDTHIAGSSKKVPQAILEAFKSVDTVIHAGDLVGLGVLEELRKVCPDVKSVWGNMDPDEVKKALPEKLLLKIGKFRFGVMHGYGAPNNLIGLMSKVFKDDAVDAVIFGHSHAPVNEKKAGILYFNPGSATDKVFAPYNSYGLIEVNDKIEARIVKI